MENGSFQCFFISCVESAILLFRVLPENQPNVQTSIRSDPTSKLEQSMDQVVAVLLTVFLTQCIRGTQGHSRGRELASFLVFETDSNITVEGPTSGLNVNIDTGNISTGVAHWVGNTDFQKVKLVASNRVSIPDYVVTLVDSGLNPISPGMSNSAGIAVHTFLSFVRGLRNEYIPSQFLTVNGSSVVGLDFKQTEAQLPVLLGEGGTMLTTTSSGRVTFSGLYLQNPVQGQYQLNITFQPPLSGAVAGRVFSNATLYFEVLPGSAHGGLQLLRSPATVSSNALLDSSPPLPLTLQPVLALLDSSGNLAHSAQDSSIVTARVDNTAGPLVVALSSAERLGGEVVTTVNGLALFSRLGFRGRPGAQYTISFLRANDAAAASSATTAKVAVRPCADQRAVGDERGNCDCPAGFVKEDDTVFHGDLLRCDECPSGQYRAAADLSCRTCPLNMRTFVAAAPSAQQCECEVRVCKTFFSFSHHPFEVLTH